MDSVEDYVRQWIKREKEEVDTLSEWVKAIRRHKILPVYNLTCIL